MQIFAGPEAGAGLLGALRGWPALEVLLHQGHEGADPVRVIIERRDVVEFAPACVQESAACVFGDFFQGFQAAAKIGRAHV